MISQVDKMSRNLFLLFLIVQSVSSLYISIDEDKGNDSNDCLQGQHSCQSLMYVSHSTINISSSLTIKIISSTLGIQESVVFTGINGLLTITGQRSNIKCTGNENNLNGSGIVFNKCKNVNLTGFTVEYCGLVYQQKKYYGLQAVLFYKCSSIFLSLVNFTNSNGTGLVLYHNTGSSNIFVSQCTFSNNILSDRFFYPERDTAHQLRFTGGGFSIIRVHEVTILISFCQFVNNSASFGGALSLNDIFNSHILIPSCRFINNTAGTSGGAVAITVHRKHYSLSSVYSIGFYFCYINGNTAQFGGGVAIQIPHDDRATSQPNTILFHFCNFIGNKGKVTSAVDINGSSQKLYQSIYTIIKFQTNNQFINNTAGINLQGSGSHKGKLFKATVFAIDVKVILNNKLSFYNNIGTPIYVLNSHLHLGKFKSNITFVNNTGDCGGAIFMDNGAMDIFLNTTLHFLSNSAVIGGAIFIQSLNIMQYRYEGTCFLQNNVTTLQLHFINNNATSGIGHNIFASTLQPCVQLYQSNTTALFTDGRMGTFNFSSSVSHSVSTAPATLLLNETHLFPFPGLPYTMNVIQLDELNHSVTNLQLFPLSATWLYKTLIKINLTHSIGHNYKIIFIGQVGDNGTLLLQTTEYSAALYINVTLFQCPPGYIFQADTCHCSHSTNSLYYYGIPHCLENRNAVISTGTWAGYVKEEFATADCVVSLCDYHASKRYEEHILPLDYSLLNDQVCAPHRNGVLCGNCITGYTTYHHSPSYHCGESTHCQYGPLLYVLSEIIPVTVIFLVILLFNINLTSGALYSFIFYSQIVSNHYTQYQPHNDTLKYFFSTFKIVYGIFDLSVFEVDELSFCLFKSATVMDLMLIKYLTTLYALLLIIVTILVLRANSLYFCIKLCHKCGRRNIRGSIVNALTAFLVLCYFHCLVITLHILVPSYVMGEGGRILKTVPLYSGDLSYMSDDHFKYAIPAIICLAFIILPPPIVLLSEPFLVRINGALNIRRNAVTYTLHRLRMKLKPFLDSFQGCFKDNHRCFAGLFFLYRILIVLTPIYFPEGTFWNITMKETLLFLILLLHSLCAPFQQESFNHLTSFLLIDLLLINMLQLALVRDWYDSTIMTTTVLQFVLMSLPLVYLLGYIGQYCKKYLVQNDSESVDDNDELPARLVPGLMESYNTF